MKRIITLMLLLVAFVGSTMAWKPVIKETHWFGMYEYEDYKNEWGWMSFTVKKINWSGNYIESIEVAKQYTGQTSQQTPKTSYYSWLDRQLRFSVNVPGNWDVDRNNNSNYQGLGLYNKADGATNFWIRGLKAGDQFNIEYYRDPNNNNSPFLVSGNVEGRTAQNSYDGNSAIYGGTYSNPVYYTISSNCDVEINIPSHAVIRSVTIKHASYQKATYETEKIEDNGNIGYKTTMTGAGVLEDKRGAIPYITMRFGAENDMTFVRNVGSPGNGVTYYAASSIVDENNDFNPSSAKLQAPYRSKSEADMRKFLAGKEWSVFTAEQENGGDIFNSIYPLYGSYFYFFPEVDGKLIMEFYCEGSEETPAFWYKKRADGTFPQVEDQPSVTKEGVNGAGRTSGGNFYRFTVDVDKGGIYYLCSLPTNIAHEHPILRLISYAFIPEFRLDPLWYVATDAEKASGTIDHAAETNQDFTITTDGQHVDLIKDIKYEGNIASAEPYFEGKVLKFRNIKYKSETENDPTLNDGGAIIVSVECASGKAKFVLTVPYSAEKAIADKDANNHYLRVKDPDTESNPNGKVVKKWDFFSNSYYLGKYSNPNSLLHQETDKPDGLTADWVDTYMDLEKPEERIFKSVYDMEGDNADMIKETEGLVFFTETNQLGIFNENDPSNSEFRDRYIGLMGGEMWIPNLKEGDRIVMKMGRYGKDSQGADKAHLTIENAQDAIGNPITGDYVIGGSGVATGNDLNNGADITDPSQPWGEYHFISTGGHFKLKVTDATLLKLYSIVIYKHDDTILTENELLGDEEHRQILNTAEFTRADNVQLRLHYRGLMEATNYSPAVEAKTGNLVATDVNVSDMTSNQSLWYTYTVALPNTPADAKFGVFKARQGVQTIGEDYVTDYADIMIPVGYRETMTYPYTWDFTDLKKYTGDGIAASSENEGNELQVNDDDLKIWNEYGLRVTPEQWDGNIFVSGGQLYGGKTMFDETRGIGITHDNNNKVMTMTGDGTDLSGGLKVGNGTIGFIVPQVDKEQAIYVRATKVGGTQKATYEVSDGTTTYTYSDANATTLKSVAAQDESGDVIFAMAMSDDLTKKCDVKLTFQGYEVKKIAVSDDFKQLSDKGWATESRGRIIDPELTSYMTGVPFENLVITSINYTDKTIGYEVVRTAPETEGSVVKKAELMPACADDGGSEAYILHNTKNAPVEILNGGFHLFVPDMHDYGTTTDQKSVKDMSSTKMKAKLNEGYVERTETIDGVDCINFVLTDTWTHLKPDGTPYGRPETSEEAFYQIPSVPTTGIWSIGHQGYLPVPKDEVAGAPRFTFMFMGDDDTTGIDETISTIGEENDENATYFNLNGQKLNGRPTQRGIYIVNGKKIVKK